MISEDQHHQLLEILTDARTAGFLGPGPVEVHVRHSLGFAEVLAGDPPTRALDLGSGGGVPGLVLAVALPASRWTLLDAGARRAAFLEAGVDRLGLAERVVVCAGRAEELGRDPALRGHFDAVVARGFGPPAVVAECAAPFLRVGGRLVVSEPPERDDRWPLDGVAVLGLVPVAGTGPYRSLRQASLCPERFPRRVGVPGKRPLF